METVDQLESNEQLPITSSTLPSEGSLDHHQNIITEPTEESQNPHPSVEQSNNSIVADISEENLTRLQSNIMTTVQPNKFNGSESPCIWLSKLTAWQKFNKLTDNAVLDYIPCLLEGSAGTWFQTLNPTQYQTLQAFKDLLSERYKPASYKMAMLGIRQESGETCEKYLERAERLALAHHDLDESYKVQFIANGLISNIRGRVLAREPQTFQALRRDISLVQLELGCEQQVSFVAHNPTFDLSELTKSINTHIEQTVTAQINALADRFHESPKYYYREERTADPENTDIKIPQDRDTGVDETRLPDVTIMRKESVWEETKSVEVVEVSHAQIEKNAQPLTLGAVTVQISITTALFAQNLKHKLITTIEKHLQVDKNKKDRDLCLSSKRIGNTLLNIN